MTTYELAEAFVQSLPQEILEHHIRSSDDPSWGQERTFTDQAVDCIADEFQAIIASAIAMMIDAGSERDAIMEDEQLALALRTTLKGW
jgi:hypothetical protein